MNKNPFVPQPSYTPQQPPLPPGPPPPQPAQPDYSAYWAAAAAHHQQQQQPHVQPPTVGTYNPQWSVTQPPRPPPEQSALYANYGYGTQQNSHWQRQQQQQQQQQQYHAPPPPVAQPPPPAPGYNPYQPTSGYPSHYVSQAITPQPMAQPAYHPPPPQPQQQFFPQHIPPQQQQQQHQQQQQPRHIHHTPPQHLPPAKRQRFDGPNPNRHNQNQHHVPPPQPQFQPPPPPPAQSLGPYPGPSHGPGRGGGPTGPSHMQMGGGQNRGGAPGGRGGIGNGQRGGRGGPITGGRGGLGGRGRGGGSGYIGGGNSGTRGGGGTGGALRGHGSRGNFGGGNKEYHNRRGGGSFANSGGGGGGAYPHQGTSFRGRGQSHSNPGRGRHDGGGGATFGTRDGPMSSSFGSTGKKDENRRTLTDFKIVGLEIRDLVWTWPSSMPAKNEAKEEVSSSPEISKVTVKDEVMDDSSSLKPGSVLVGEEAPHTEPSVDGVSGAGELPMSSVDPKAPQEESQPTGPRVSDLNTTSPPPSRIRIYFHTPVTADDSRPIPHNSSFSFGVTPSDSRKGKRKKLEDDDGDLEEGRAPPPPPQMGSGMSDDRSSVAASVAPSIAETASEADWLMAAIAEDEEEAEAEGELDPDGEEEDEGDQLHVSQIEEALEIDGSHDSLNEDDGNLPIVDAHMAGATDDDNDTHTPAAEAGNDSGAPAEKGATITVAPDGLDVSSSGAAELIALPSGVADTVPAISSESQQHDGAEAALSLDSATPVAANGIASVLVAHPDVSPHVEEQPADVIGHPDTQVLGVPPLHQLEESKSLLAVSAEPTILDINSQDASPSEDSGTSVVNGNGEHHEDFATQDAYPGDVDASQADHLPEPPASPTSNTLLSTSSTSTYGESPSQTQVKADVKAVRTPSANRLSISYAGGNRRLVVDAEVVEHLKVFRHDGRIEVRMNITKEGEDSLKGILMEGLSDVTKSYLPLQTLSDLSDSDATLPPFSKVLVPSSLTLVVYLDTARPLSEPKWAKSGDVQEWLKSMFGRMFWVAGDAAEGWEKKIQVVDPDPPPTIWTVLEGWAVNSPVGVANERQRFLKTHMTEIDNILEILLRLVRGERATPFSQTAPTISAPSVSGPLLSALSPGSAHGAQQTHVSLAVLAMFRMSVEYGKKALGDDKGRSEIEERAGEIIRCLPSHLIYKSLDGIFKEWRVEKKGR